MKKLFFTTLALLSMAVVPSFGDDETPENSKLDHALATQPAGTLIDEQSWDGHAFYRDFFTYEKVVSGLITKYVIGDDGYFYLYSPLSNYPTDSWIKGTIEGDTVTFQPQIIRTDSYGDDLIYDHVLKAMKYNEDSTSLIVDSINPAIKFVYRNDTLRLAEGQIMGVVDDYDYWESYADWNVVISPIIDNSEVLDDGVEVQKYMLSYLRKPDIEDCQLVDVAFDGEQVYIGNFDNATKDVYYMGTLKDGKVTFESPQYLKPDSDVTRCHLYGMAGTAEQGEDGLHFPIWIYSLGGELEFEYLKGGELMTSNDVMVINKGTNYLDYDQIYAHPTLTKFEDKALTPKDPVMNYGYECQNEGEYGEIYFTMVPKSTTGEFLVKDSLYYNVFMNDELYTFSVDKYSDIPEDMTDVPFTYDDGYDFYINNNDYNFYYYEPGVDSIGVQLCYKGGGTVTKSNIVFTCSIPVMTVSMQPAPTAKLSRLLTTI